MKIKSGFMLREIAGQWVVVPLGNNVVEFNGLMTLSSTGAIIWKILSTGGTPEDALRQILKDYKIDEDTARADVDEFVNTLSEKGLLE